MSCWIPADNVHQDLAPVLANVETAVRADSGGGTAGLRDVRGFVPPPIRGGRTLSRRGVGRAIDLNPDALPTFIQLEPTGERRASLFRVIAAVTGVDLRTTTDYAAQGDASAAVQATFDDGWVAQQQAELARREAAAHAGPKDAALRKAGRQQHRLVADILRVWGSLDHLAATGFLNLQAVVVQQLPAAGFTWGGECGDYKDFVHFQLGSLGP